MFVQSLTNIMPRIMIAAVLLISVPTKGHADRLSATGAGDRATGVGQYEAAVEQLVSARVEIDVLNRLLEQVRGERNGLSDELSTAHDEINRLEQSLQEQEDETDEALAQFTDMENQVKELEPRVEVLEARLSAAQEMLDEQFQRRVEAEEQLDSRDVEIARLEGRLNQALLREVETLQQRRGHALRDVNTIISETYEFDVIGGRMIMPSDLFFPTGSADMVADGEDILNEFANNISSVVNDHYEGQDWILRIDVHTNSIPIATPDFPSNWELSAGRALAILRFLADQGVPQSRMAMGGFGEFHPIADGASPEALARNRRVELGIELRGAGL